MKNIYHNRYYLQYEQFLEKEGDFKLLDDHSPEKESLSLAQWCVKRYAPVNATHYEIFQWVSAWDPEGYFVSGWESVKNGRIERP